MARDRTDYTIFWRRLSHAMAAGGDDVAMTPVRDLFIAREDFDGWLAGYRARLGSRNASEAGHAMLRANPKFVLRNHLAELAIRRAQTHDFSEVRRLLALLQSPFDEHPGSEADADFPPDWASSIEISCSS